MSIRRGNNCIRDVKNYTVTKAIIEPIILRNDEATIRNILVVNTSVDTQVGLVWNRKFTKIACIPSRVLVCTN